MKTGWKWSFVAQATLAIALVLETYFVAAAVVYVLPSNFAWHRDLGTPPFAYLETIRWLADGLYMHSLWVPCLLLALAGWGLFEWRCRGEKKSIVRLTGLSLASFTMFLVLVVVCVPMVVDLVLIPRQMQDVRVDLTPQQAERIVEGNAALPAVTQFEVGLNDGAPDFAVTLGACTRW